MRVVLKGPIGCQWDLGSGMRGAGVSVDLTPKELKNAESSDLINHYIDEKPKTLKKIIKYTKEELEDKTFTELKKIGKKFNVTDRSKTKIIKEILEAQK